MKEDTVSIDMSGRLCHDFQSRSGPIILEFNSMGYQAAVLRYSCAPAVYPTALCEVAQSVKLIREHAEDWNVDAEKIIVMGFSAGGIWQPVMVCFGMNHS